VSSIVPQNFPENNLKQILAYLLIDADKNPNQFVEAIDISKGLLGIYGINLHYKTIDAILDRNKEFISRKKKKHQYCYKLLTAGNDYLANQGSVTIINPENPVPAIASVTSILKSLNGSVLICDPYIDSVSLNFLDSIPLGCSIKLLSHNVKDNGEFRTLILGLRRKGSNLEIRKVVTKILHDRYIIDKNNIFFLGTSLNGIGSKQSFIFRMGSDIRNSVEPLFQVFWNNAVLI